MKEPLMTDRTKPTIFVKTDAHFFYSSNILRQDDAGNHSFEHWQYFFFPSFSCFRLGYTVYCTDISVAEIQMNHKYIIMKNNVPGITGSSWGPNAAKPYSTLSRTALKLRDSWNKWEWMSRSFHCKILYTLTAWALTPNTRVDLKEYHLIFSS